MSQNLRVAVLVDLPRSALSGGHVKGWERRAKAVANSDLSLDMTIFFSGEEKTEHMGDRVHLRQLPPVFSTKNLKFLPYVPDNTDLAPYHPKLAKELKNFDVIHTTDGFFAFAQTAERISKKHGIPLVTSFHTDTPAYAEVFTKKTLESLFGQSRFARFLIETCKIPQKERLKKEKRLRKHLACCCEALATRAEDHALANEIIGASHVHDMHLGVDREMFSPTRADRENIEKEYGIPKGRKIGIFVGRLDVGKNIYTLIEATEKLIAEGQPIHIITAGVGPAEQDLKNRLGAHVSVAGFIDPQELGRLYASVDFLALTSEVEIRSLVGIEAMASGLPVLVSEKSEIAPLYHNTPAMKVVAGKGLEWANAIRDFITDEAMQKMMRQEAKAYDAEHLLSWQEVMDIDFLSMWKKAAISGKRG